MCAHSRHLTTGVAGNVSIFLYMPIYTYMLSLSLWVHTSAFPWDEYGTQWSSSITDQTLTNWWHTVYWIYSWTEFHFIQYICHRNYLSLSSVSLSGEDSKMSIYECPNSTNWWHTQMLTHQVSFISCIIKKQPLQNQWLLGKQSTDSSGETRPTDTTTNGRELCRTSPIETKSDFFI